MWPRVGSTHRENENMRTDRPRNQTHGKFETMFPAHDDWSCIPPILWMAEKSLSFGWCKKEDYTGIQLPHPPAPSPPHPLVCHGLLVVGARDVEE